MKTKRALALGLSMGLFIGVGCGSSTSGSPDGAAGQGGGTSRDGGAGGGGGGAGGGIVATGGRGTGGLGSGGARTGAGGGAGGAIDGSSTPGLDGGATAGCSPAVTRGGQYFTFTEKFNRYYTDCAWQPGSTVYVSPTGTGNGSTPADAASVASALAAAVPGRMIVFAAGTYSGCYELDSDRSGTYDDPIVLVGEKKADGSPAVIINCCTSGRRTCINLEAADYVAIDGFELSGGDYGVRAVGASYAADGHQKGVAVLNNVGHGQNKDPFFTGQSDWFVIERCTGYDSGSGDGHGIYLSNGSDWNIARWNETYNTVSSDFQINADPISTCEDEGIAYDSPECDAVAGSHPTGGRGASDFMLIEANFFHHSKAQGPNFTSVRNSAIKNNIFALPARHGASFWQETDNPKLGASNNFVAHNLFVTQTANRQAIGVTNNSTGNQFKNNIVLTVSINGGTVSASASGQLLATDATTVQANTFEHNIWISGFFGSEDSAPEYAPNATELRLTDFDAAWFAAFPPALARDPAGFAPSATAPWLDNGNLLPEVPSDRAGTPRHAPVDLGPYER
ncbi:MAG: hypothetical protein JXP73_18620 [Deltaproteobacteria bacterium]|nr:hypothetical protein [Deltaproteobacteria bacterium]